MSRFSGNDDYDGEPGQVLAWGRWQRNARAVLTSKRGRKALAELREALMALPEHRLIEGAVCTVGADQRRAALIAEAKADADSADEWSARWAAERPDDALAQRLATVPHVPSTSAVEDLDAVVKDSGEGVCAVGAYAWYRKVKAGMDPAEAFASLPDLADEGSDALGETARLGEAEGLAYTLAWELAYRNDETLRDCTPDQRWERFVAWIDERLAVSAP